jgi:hypothetical protein
MKTFATIVEEVKNLSFEEKEELSTVLEKILVEERRKEILLHHEQSMKEHKEGKLKFYDSPKDSLNMLNEE